MKKASWTFQVGLLTLLVALAAFVQPQFAGDWSEYSLMAIAIERHGGADIRLEDVRAAQRAMPSGTAEFERIANSIGSPSSVPALWFFRAKNGAVFASHFFAYSALVAAPMAALGDAGSSPGRAFLIVNSLFVFVLGIALYRLFGSPQRAALGLLLFMLAGGFGYWQWTSTECMTAAAFLAALIFFTSGAPLSAGVLAGLATVQNPPLIAFVFFAPLFAIAMSDDTHASLRATTTAALNARNLAGLCIVIAFGTIPVLFNLWAWGVPSIIAATATNPALVSAERLLSYYFDLNQGLVVGVPGICLALAMLAVRAAIRSPADLGRMAMLLGTAVLWCMALAIPGLTTTNWNSASAGMMRYAFWGSVPLLFLLFHWMARMPKWPASLLVPVLLLQGGATYVALRSNFLDFGPAAKAVLAHMPQIYNPEPELFAERTTHEEKPLDAGRAYVYVSRGVPMKALVRAGSVGLGIDLCGPGARISAFGSRTSAGQGWEYFNGPFVCARASAREQPIALGPDEFNGRAMRLESGWSTIEDDHAGWHGVWSDGASSVLTIRLSPPRDVHQVTVLGEYYRGNRETRVRINGIDFGRRPLAPSGTIELGPAAGRQSALLRIELAHEAPRDPAADASNKDPRHLAFFLRRVEIQ